MCDIYRHFVADLLTPVGYISATPFFPLPETDPLLKSPVGHFSYCVGIYFPRSRMWFTCRGGRNGYIGYGIWVVTWLYVRKIVRQAPVFSAHGLLGKSSSCGTIGNVRYVVSGRRFRGDVNML